MATSKWDIMEANYRSANPNVGMQKYQAFKKAAPKQRSGIAPWLPAIGAIGVGAAAAPFTGGMSLAGSIAALGAAGAIGGGLGEYGAQRMSGEKFNQEKIAKEALWSGAFGAGGQAFTGLRAAKAAGVPLSAAMKARPETLRAGAAMAKAAKSGLETTAVNRFGARELGEVRGIYGGAKIGGKPITAQRAREINNFLGYEVKAKGAIATQLEKTENYRNALTSQLDDMLRKNNYNLNQGEIKSIIANTKQRFSPVNFPGMSKPAKTMANEYTRDLAQVKNLKELNKFRINLDKQINFARNKDTVDPIKEQVAMAFRKSIDKHLTTQVPAGKALKGAMSKAYDAEALLGKTLGTMTGGKGDVRLIEIVRNAAPMQGIRTGIGTAAATSGAKGASLGIANKAVSQGLPRALMNLSRPPQVEAPDAYQDPSLLPSGMNQGYGAQDYGMQNMGQAPQQGLSLEQALQQAYQLAPNGSESELLSYAKALQASSGGGKDLTSGSVGTLTDYDSGISDLQNLLTNMQNSNLSDPIVGAVRGLNPYDTEAQNLQAEIDRVRQVVGKALEGGVLRKEDEVKYKRILPTLRDKPEVARYKIMSVLQALQSKRAQYLQNYQNYGGAVDPYQSQQQLDYGSY